MLAVVDGRSAQPGSHSTPSSGFEPAVSSEKAAFGQIIDPFTFGFRITLEKGPAEFTDNPIRLIL
jgi:hypothetical protein